MPKSNATNTKRASAAAQAPAQKAKVKATNAQAHAQKAQAQAKEARGRTGLEPAARQLRAEFSGHPFRGVSDNKKLPPPPRNSSYDHVLELQVAAAAEKLMRADKKLNGVPRPVQAVAERALVRLLDTADESNGVGNVVAVDAKQNRAKGAAIKRYIAARDNPAAAAALKAGDEAYVDAERQQWSDWRKDLPRRVVAMAQTTLDLTADERKGVRQYAAQFSNAVTAILPIAH